MFRRLNVSPYEIVLSPFVRTNRRRETRLNVRFFYVAADPHVSFFVNHANCVGFQCLQPLQKRRIMAAEHQINVGALARNHGLARRAFRGLNVQRSVLVIQHGKVSTALQAIGGAQMQTIVGKCCIR